MTRELGASIPQRLVTCAICGYTAEVPMFHLWYRLRGGTPPAIYICDIHHHHSNYSGTSQST